MKRINATTRRGARHTRGAAMVETVLVLPFIMIMIVLIIYLGWNFRRLALVTNMDRYSVWERVTPGAPGPDHQGLEQDMRNPRLNNAFFGINGDLADHLDERHDWNHYTPQGHENLRDMQADETYSYFEEFLERNPRAIHERFRADHGDYALDFEEGQKPLEFRDKQAVSRTTVGHSRMDGDWRYVNGIRYNSGREAWEPAYGRVAPGSSLREVFFSEIDDGLDPYVDNDNNLARAIRDFYFSYPSYRGPDVGSSWGVAVSPF